VVLGTSPAAAQGKAFKWELEGHVGGVFLTNPTGGTTSLPPGGTVYVPAAGFPPSRAVSSWYFGDGAALFNDVRRTFSFIPSITPLDPVLTGAGVERNGGLSFGFRLTRALNDRFGVEFDIDAGLGHAVMNDGMRAGIEASTTSFELAFSRAAFSPAESIATIRQEGGTRLSAIGALNINLLTPRRLTPYVSIGAGVVSAVGDLPSATIVGTYQVPDLELGIPAVVETDTVSIRYEERTTPIFMLGGGVKLDLTPRSGIRGDVRFAIGPNNDRIAIDATPSEPRGSGTSLTYIAANWSMVFSSSGTRQTSLSGPPVTGFETYSASGSQVQTTVALGYFVRF
jgi:hypothetical protein